jgi:hypothetical protein
MWGTFEKVPPRPLKTFQKILLAVFFTSSADPCKFQGIHGAPAPFDSQ